MNKHVLFPKQRVPTQAAEGLPRWRWTTAELEAIDKLGLFGEYEHFELIGGEIVPMSPTGRRHEIVCVELADFFRKLLGETARVAEQHQFNLAPDTYTEPDILVHPRSIKLPDVDGAAALLLIEIADSSRNRDLTQKAALYALHGVRDYWVIDAWSLETTIHRDPEAGGYRSIAQLAGSEPVTSLLVPQLSVRLAALDLD